MDPAAQFLAVVAHRDDANFVRVLLAKEHHRSGLLSRFFAHESDVDRRSLGDAVVDDVLNLEQFLGSHGSSVREVKAEYVVLDLRTALHRVLAEHRVEAMMQQMRGRVSSTNPRSTI